MRLRKLDNTEAKAIKAAIGRKAYVGVHRDDITKDVRDYLLTRGWDEREARQRADVVTRWILSR